MSRIFCLFASTAPTIEEFWKGYPDNVLAAHMGAYKAGPPPESKEVERALRVMIGNELRKGEYAYAIEVAPSGMVVSIEGELSPNGICPDCGRPEKDHIHPCGSSRDYRVGSR